MTQVQYSQIRERPKEIGWRDWVCYLMVKVDVNGARRGEIIF